MAAFRLFPELDLLAAPAARHEVYRVALRKLGWRWQYLLFAAVAPVVAVLAAHVGLTELGRVAPYVAQFRTLFFAAAAGVALPLSFQYLFRRTLQVAIREELNRRGVPVCIGCGYDLRGQETPRCPECGRGFAPPT
jgi:hypothetical protein